MLIGGIVVAVLWGTSGTSNDPSRDDSSTSKVADPADRKFGSRARPSLSIPEAPIKEVLDASTRVAPRSITLSPKARRPGERESAYERRMTWLQKFDEYVESAQLTDEQQRQLLETMADMQTEAVASLQLLDGAIRDVGNDNLPSVADMEKSMSQDFLARLTTFLSREQVISFRRKSTIGSMLGYGYWQPLVVGSDGTPSSDGG